MCVLHCEQIDESEHARIVHEATQVDKKLKGEVNSLQLEEEAKIGDDDAL